MAAAKIFPAFKEFDVKAVAVNRRLKPIEANLSLDESLSGFICLPDELLQSIILFSGIFAKSTLAQLCKRIYFIFDFQLELQMYNTILNGLRRQDFRFKLALEHWYKNSLVLRACAFDDLEYLKAVCGSEIPANPFIKQDKRSEPLLSFSLLHDAESVTLFDYFVLANEDVEKISRQPWKYIDNVDFQSFLWISTSSLANRLVVDSMPIQIVKGSLVDKIMSFASKYSHILIRLILALSTNPGSLSSTKFPPILGVRYADFLSDLLQHKESYPFDLTSVCPKKQITHNVDYMVPPLASYCEPYLFKVIMQHSRLVPDVGYLANLGLIKMSARLISQPTQLIDEFYAHGADVNAPLHLLKRKKAKHVNGLIVDSALGVARFARGYGVDTLAWIEWLLSHGAKFSDYEMDQIEKSIDLMALTKDYRRVISDGNYKTLSHPVMNWQGPKKPNNAAGLRGPCMRLLDERIWSKPGMPYNFEFSPNQRCFLWSFDGKGSRIEYRGTWSTNETDNVITFDVVNTGDSGAQQILFKFRVFSAFNGTALLVTDEHLEKRGETDTVAWLTGLYAENGWMTF